jgi:hypothetical protein
MGIRLSQGHEETAACRKPSHPSRLSSSLVSIRKKLRQSSILSNCLKDSVKVVASTPWNDMKTSELFGERTRWDCGSGTFDFLAIDTVLNYLDAATLPATRTSAVWKYKPFSVQGHGGQPEMATNFRHGDNSVPRRTRRFMK